MKKSQFEKLTGENPLDVLGYEWREYLKLDDKKEEIRTREKIKEGKTILAVIKF